MSDGGDRFFNKLCEAKARIDARGGGDRSAYDRLVRAVEALRMARDAFDLVAGHAAPRSLLSVSAWVHRAWAMLPLQASQVYRIAETDLAEAAREYALAREAFLAVDRTEAVKRATRAAVERFEGDMRRVSLDHSFPRDPEAPA